MGSGRRVVPTMNPCWHWNPRVWGPMPSAAMHGARARWPSLGRVRAVGPDDARDGLGAVMN
jgi:hypothetical protein